MNTADRPNDKPGPTQTLANQLRQHAFVSIVITLITPALLVAGVLLIYSLSDRNWSAADIVLITFLATAAFVVGGAFSAWLAMRLPASALNALDQIERALTDATKAENAASVHLPRLETKNRSSIFRAYNSVAASLEESDARRMEFLSKIAHDLRAPLMSITGYAVLLVDPAMRLPPDAVNYGRTIAKQAERVHRLIDNMVSAAKVDEGRLDMSPTLVRLGLLLQQVIGEAHQSSGREIILDDQLNGAQVMGDMLRLREVFFNLLDNAVKFSPPGAPVRVGVRRAAEGKWAEIEIEDQGIGIAAADMPLLFRRFGRIQNEQTHGIQGSGLGLYIANYIIQRHQGQISINSQPGQGSTFTVRLPLGVGTE